MRAVNPLKGTLVPLCPAVWGGLCACVVLAAPPIVPLGTPLYSFDQASPSVAGAFVNPNDVLMLNLPYPSPVITGAMLGLGQPGDDLDALSGGNGFWNAQTVFAIRFSVTRASTGDVPIPETLVTANVPYNVMDQAGRGHQAGDEYMTLRLFSLSAMYQARDQSLNNHTMVNNNYDEGGSDFAGRPETHGSSMTVGQPQDNVDALASVDASAVLYYSATSNSPSLAVLPGSGNPSGARVFRYFAGIIGVFASPADLGLLNADDIDGLVVFDFNQDGLFNGSDRVLFSLTPGSPSGALIPGASANHAADVFLAIPGVSPKVFAAASSIGLAGGLDDIDALEVYPCEVAITCAATHGIRRIKGDFNNDGNVDNDDLDEFDGCYRGEGEPYEPGCEPGDFDEDEDIDCMDGKRFVLAWTAEGEAGVPQACANVIPTVSQWGVVVLGLVLLCAASLILRRVGPSGHSHVRNM